MMENALTNRLEKLRERLRGRLELDADLAPYTWFRVGGPAWALFVPEDEADLALFLEGLPAEVPVHVMGLASNTLFRDGGFPGVLIRLGRGFGQVEVLEGAMIRAGAAVPDMKLAKTAASAGIAGFSFFRGIPGAVGGALRMNAGAHGGETRDRVIEVTALDRAGQRHVLGNDAMGYAYRHSSASPELIFTSGLFQGEPGDPAALKAEMEDVVTYREANQPTRDRTGGSTFKNPPENSAWKLIDAAGCRGLRIGGAQVSEKHCNFLINTGEATAHDLELLGETVRQRVFEQSGILLEWEIKRIGAFEAGRAVTPFTPD